jgi:hypothetical protein
MSMRPIATISRAHNGWLVTTQRGTCSNFEKTYLCMTWEEVERRVKQAAFDEHTEEPRLP